MAKTRGTLATKIDTLGERVDKLGERVDQRFEQIDRRFEQIDQRFEQVDQRFDQVDTRFEEVKAQLKVQIEAVDSTMHLVLERMDEFLKRDVGNSAAHARMDTRIDAHELRITALERGERPAG